MRDYRAASGSGAVGLAERQRRCDDALLAALSPWAEDCDIGADYRGEIGHAEAGASQGGSATAAQAAQEMASSGLAAPSVAVAVSGGLAELLAG